MRHLRMLAITGWLALGGAGSAIAADLPLPPAPVLAPVAEDFGGWYLRGDVGVGIGQLTSQKSTFNPAVTVPDFAIDNHNIRSAALLGAGVGYQFNSWFRADVTGEWRNRQGYRVNESYNGAVFGIPCANGRCGDAYYGKVQTTALFLANGYFDLGTWSGLTPYVGAGLGTGYTKFGPIQDFGTDPAAAGYGYAPGNTRWRFAWALMAGVGYAISPNLMLDVGYRYLDLGKIKSEAFGCANGGVCANEIQSAHLASHDVRVGLRWLFGAPVAPPSAPPPLVRKY